MLDNNVNQNQQIAYQALQAGLPEANQVPMEAAIQANPELLKENIQDSYVGSRVSETTEDPKAMLKTGLLAIPLWFLNAQLMDKFAKKSRGNYEDTIQYKIGNYGDKIANTVTESKFGKSNFAQSLNKRYHSIKDFLKTKIVDKSRILKAFAYTPSRPELDMFIGQYEGIQGMQLFDYPQHIENFCKPRNHIADLDCYGATKEEIAAFETQLKSIPKEGHKAFIQEAEYKTLLKHSKDPTEAARLASQWADKSKRASILQDLKAFEGGYKNFADMNLAKEKTAQNMAKILDATLSANKDMFARIWGTKSSARGRASLKLFGREVFARETANKLAAEFGNDLYKPEYTEIRNILQKHGYLDKLPKTYFGRFFNKYAHFTLEATTNRVAGGKFLAVVQAAYLADVIYKSLTQKGGMSEKAKSFAERFAEMLSFFICMPFALQLMHKVGGLQYAGLTKEQVAKYREHLKIHNEKAMNGEFASKEAWKASKDSLKKELNAGVKNPITKLFKRGGRIITVGLEQIRPYDKKSIGVVKDGKTTFRKGVLAKIKDLFHHPKFGIKQMAGYPMRIALGMFILLPMFNKLAVKTSHLIFGKPKHSLLDEGKEAQQTEKSTQTKTELPPQLQKTQSIGPVEYDQYGRSKTNMLNKYRNGQAIQGYQNTQNYNSTITSQQTTNPQEPVRTYVPSPVGVVLNGQEDLTAAEAAMKRADTAEEQALQALKMN